MHNLVDLFWHLLKFYGKVISYTKSIAKIGAWGEHDRGVAVMYRQHCERNVENMLTAQKAAKDLLEKYGTNDPFELCDVMNLPVVAADLPESVRGFSIYIKSRHIIYLNEILDTPMQRQVCAHELGHIILHPEHNLIFMLEHTMFVYEKFEQEADQFCASLLFEEEMLAEATTVQELAQVAGVDLHIAYMMAEQQRITLH